MTKDETIEPSLAENNGLTPSEHGSSAALRAQEHDLKCWPEFFRYLWSGEKTFELRVDDRGYRAGDTLLQREWSKKNGYTGRWIKFDVPFVFSGTWLASNCVCMSLKELKRYEPRGLSAADEPCSEGVTPNPTEVS